MQGRGKLAKLNNLNFDILKCQFLFQKVCLPTTILCWTGGKIYSQFWRLIALQNFAGQLWKQTKVCSALQNILHTLQCTPVCVKYFAISLLCMDTGTKLKNTQIYISGMDTWTKTMVAIKVLTAFKKRRKKKKEAEVGC